MAFRSYAYGRKCYSATVVCMNIYQLDATRLICPMPVIKLQEKIKGLVAGDKVELVCNDRGVLHDIPAWCRVHGHAVEQIEQIGNTIKITVIVK